MKKIIAGKRYDTETAELVVEWSNGHYGNDFRKCSEDLYKTKAGTWFIHGEGGPMTSYALAQGDMHTGGEDIRPLTAEEAMNWLEQKGFPEEIEKHFPNQVKDA